MKYRAIMVDFWQDPEYQDWTFEEKSFYVYLITSPYTGLSGFMRLSIPHIAADTGLPQERIIELIDRLAKKRKVFIADKYLWIRNFLKYQNAGGVKIHARVINELKEVLCEATAPLIREMLSMYPELQQASGYGEIMQLLSRYSTDTTPTSQNTVSIPYRYPIDTVPITETESETETVNNNIAFSFSDKTNVLSSKENVSAQACADAPSSTDVNDLETESKKTERVPYQKIIEIYHEECPDLPRVKVLNETRKRLLRARWKERPDLEFWRKYFKRVHASDFLCGRVEPRNGKPPFLADFEWLIRPNNFAKVLEGKYDNRASPKTDPDVEAVLREFGVGEAR